MLAFWHCESFALTGGFGEREGCRSAFAEVKNKRKQPRNGGFIAEKRASARQQPCFGERKRRDGDAKAQLSHPNDIDITR